MIRILKFSMIIFPIIVFTVLAGCNKENSPADNPVAKFAYTSTATVPVTVQFTNLSSNPAGITSTYLWNFGDGSNGTTTDATHVYFHLGVYMVQLTQTPSSGSPDVYSSTLTISAQPGPAGTSDRMDGTQTAMFNYSIASRAYAVTFANTSSNASTYLWKFGDGTTSTTDSATVVHTYITGGTYHVNLTATGSSGTDSTGATITF